MKITEGNEASQLHNSQTDVTGRTIKQQEDSGKTSPADYKMTDSEFWMETKLQY